MIRLKKAEWIKFNHPMGGDWYAWGDTRVHVVRIVLPELEDYTQTLIDPDKHLVEFDRTSKNKRRLRQ